MDETNDPYRDWPDCLKPGYDVLEELRQRDLRILRETVAILDRAIKC